MATTHTPQQNNQPEGTDASMPPATSPEPVAPPSPAKSGLPKKPLIAGIVVVCLIILGFALTQLMSSKDKTQETVQKRVVKVGLMAPLSGANAGGGTSQKQGIELAIKEANIEGVTIQLVPKDTGCDATKVEAAVNELVNEGVVAIIGDACSGATLAAAPLVNKHHIPLVSQASTNAAVTQAGDYVFRTIPSDAFQGEFAAGLIQKAGLKRLAVIYGNETYGIGLNDLIKTKFAQLGGTVVASEPIAPKSTDVTAAMDRIKAANPDALYIANNTYTSVAAILLRAQAIGLQAKLYGSEALSDPTVLTDAAGASEGLSVTAVSGGTPTFIAKYRAAYNMEVGGANAPQAYDAMMAIVQTLKQGATTGEQIKTKLYSVSFDGGSGHIAFDSNGDLSKGNYDILVVKDRKFVKQ